MEATSTNQESTQENLVTMTPREAIFWLEAILDDTLDPHDDSDAKRIEAVELAIEGLKKGSGE